jgi:hypothetical protein
MGLVAGLCFLLLGACGDDGDDSTTPSVPDITIPEGEAETTTEETTTTIPDSGSGGTTADPSKPDSPTNDLPPEPDTPEARFEEFCEKNPGVCG